MASTVPIAVWFSFALKDADEVNVGASFTSVTLTVMDWDLVFSAGSFAKTVAGQESLTDSY